MLLKNPPVKGEFLFLGLIDHFSVFLKISSVHIFFVELLLRYWPLALEYSSSSLFPFQRMHEASTGES